MSKAHLGGIDTSIHQDIQDRAQGVHPMMLQIADLFSQATDQITTQQPGQMQAVALQHKVSRNHPGLGLWW